MSESDDSLPRLLGGRYRLEAKLGSGGMGIVYRATDQTMHRAVAVKLVRGVDGVALDDEVAGRFLREAKNTARVQHENIIEVYDLGRSEQGDMFFVMELLEGQSLSAKLRRDGALPAEETVHIARQMCAALHVAHSAGIIHRDLKPANVMLVQRGDDPSFVKVLDFGVAKSYTPDQQTQLTHTGMLVGTVEYMAPEQIMGRTVDGRTDLYSLGVVMYRMLTGKPPFRDGGVPALIHAHLNVFPKPLSERNPDVPGALDRVVLRCLAKQPDQRYESMEELSRALAAAIAPPEPEYEGEDVYDEGDETQVAKRGRDRSPPPARSAQRAPEERRSAQRAPEERRSAQRAPEERRSAQRAPEERRSAPPRSESVTVPPPFEASSSSHPSDSAGGAVPARSAPELEPDLVESQPQPQAPSISAEVPDSFEDRTVKIDREPVASLPVQRPRFEPPLVDSGDRTTVMVREDQTTGQRPYHVEASGPRACAMCHTINAPHSRSCVACGVSLSNEEQEAVRARVASPAPSGPQPPLNPANPYASPFGPTPVSPGPGAPLMHAPPPRPSYPSAANWLPAPPQPPPSQSVWQRFLAWTGLR